MTLRDDFFLTILYLSDGMILHEGVANLRGLKRCEVSFGRNGRNGGNFRIRT